MHHHPSAQVLRTSLVSALAAIALVAPAQALTTVDVSTGTVATGPAGTIGNHILVTTDGASTFEQFNFITLNQSPWFSYPLEGTAVGFLNATTTADGASLVRLFGSDAGFGTKTLTFDPRGRPTNPYPYTTSIESNGGLYQALTDPALTSFQFTLSGSSATAGNGLKASVDVVDSSGQHFQQSTTWNDAGNWTLTLDSPVGFELSRFYLGLSGTGNNTLTSVRITPLLAAVPEVSTAWAMGLGLAGLALARRQRRSQGH